MGDPKHDLAADDWTVAAYRLFTEDMKEPLSVDIAVSGTGHNMPDADLDSLCDAIMGNVARSEQ